MSYFGDDIIDEIIFGDDEDDLFPILSSAAIISSTPKKYLTRSILSWEDHLQSLLLDDPNYFDMFYRMSHESFNKL